MFKYWNVLSLENSIIRHVYSGASLFVYNKQQHMNVSHSDG